MKKEIKSGYKSNGIFNGSFKELDENSRIVSGYFASFGTVDSDSDVIIKGAFAKSISERGVGSDSNRKIKYLHQHNIQEPIGQLKILKEDEVGLYFEAELEKTALGDVVLERYKNGSYREHSIGFNYVFEKSEWVELDEKEVFLCKEINLFEGSVVTFGANEQTPFTGFKGTSADFLKELEDQEKFLLKNCKNYEFEIALKQMFAREKSLFSEIAGLKATIKEKAGSNAEEHSELNIKTNQKEEDQNENLKKFYLSK